MTGNDLRQTLSMNLKLLRNKRSLSQMELAEKADISVRYMQSIEAGESFPYLPPLTRLRKALKVSWNELMEGC